MAATKKTDNDHLADKVDMRLRYAPWPSSPRPLRVLDAFGGFGVCWRVVQRLSGRPIERAWIDERHDVIDFHLHGKNQKILPVLFLEEYDCIDLDAYGVPYEQLAIILARGWKGVVFATFIQSMYGKLPVKMITDLGYTQAMYAKAPTVITRRGIRLLLDWLARMGTTSVVVRASARKCYLAFGVNGAEVRASGCDSQGAGSAAGPA